MTKGSIKSPWYVAIAYSVLGLIGIFNHAMWRDELNPWLIVRDSGTFRDLVANIHYEGHPALWYFCLAVLRQIADTPQIVQIFHWAIATAAVGIFWLYSPFRYKQKLLFSFGFFPFSEYLLISRNYAFSLLFIFGFCAAFASRAKTYLYLAVLLGLLANSSAYALFVSVALAATLLVEFCTDRQHRNQYFSQSHKYDLVLSVGIVVFCWVLAVYIITPPGDSYLYGGLSEGWVFKLDIQNLLRSISRVFGGYFLIVPQKRWLDLIVCASIGLFVAFINSIKLSKKPIPLFFYVAANSIIIAFTYLKFLGSPRHFGHLYLVLIAALWLGNYYQDSQVLRIKPRLFQFAQKWHSVVFMVILYVQLAGGIFSFSRDLVVPYSAGRETARYIQQSGLDDEFIVASRDANMAPLAGYLNRKLYYPERQQMGSFTLFKQGRKDVEQAEIGRQISLLLARQEVNKVILILNQELDFTWENFKISYLNKFEKSWIDTERYYLYKVEKE